MALFTVYKQSIGCHGIFLGDTRDESYVECLAEGTVAVAWGYL